LKRFYFGENNENEDEEEHEDEYEEEDEDDDDEDDDYESKIDFFQMAHMPSLDSDSSLMECAIKICQSSIFWMFYSINYKLNKIKEAYTFLQNIIEEENDKI